MLSPKLSLIVVASGSPEQTAKTLLTLSPGYQLHVSADDYEVLVVENTTERALGPEEMARFGNNFRHVFHTWERVHPFSACEAALQLCTAPFVGFFGHVAYYTPRLVEHALRAVRVTETPVVVVPVYDPLPEGDTGGELDDVPWASDGYEALPLVRLGPENANGYLTGLFESETFLCPRAAVDALLCGPSPIAPRRSDGVYARLLERPEAKLIVLGGEACIRQTREGHALIPGSWNRPEREPLLLAALPGHGRGFFRQSIESAAWHCAFNRDAGREEWPWDRRAPLPPEPSGVTPAPSRPALSIVVVVFRMPRQAENTLLSLSAAHQWNVRQEDYEIIVVENLSSDNLGSERACRIAPNIRYFGREERGVSPVAAFNFGVSQARAPLLGLMIDGARMVTPRVLENVLMARRTWDRPLIVVPGYHLGPERQFLSSQKGYDEHAEQKLLQSIDWPKDGHRLFEIASFDDTTLQGFMNPLLESTCLFCPREAFEEIGGADPRFDAPGGGIVNLDLFERLCHLDRTRLVVLWAEGAFHQYHGGTSSKTIEDRDRMLEVFRRQYEEIRGKPYGTRDREPHLFGSYVGPSSALHTESAEQGKVRFTMIRDWGRAEWPYD